MSFLSDAARYLPYSFVNRAARFASRSETVRKIATETIVDRYAYAAPLRPRPISMAADYPTWNGLVDRHYSGRHIERANGKGSAKEPDLDAVNALFVRDKLIEASDTSVLFTFFAQWFTDGFLRTKWEGDQQNRTFKFNESNHEIDLCQIYGQGEYQTDLLREKNNQPGRRGRLKSQIINGEEWPAPLFEEVDGVWMLRKEYGWEPLEGETEERPGLYTKENFGRVFSRASDEQKSCAFAVGLEHGNSTIGHVVMNTLFLREHNRIAAIIETAHPDWDDERVFQTARNSTIAILLHIVISDYIVHIAPIDFQIEVVPGIAETKTWYRTNWIPVEFALLYRWHDLVPDELSVNGEALPAQNFRNNNKWVQQNGLEAVLRAASRQPAGQIGLGNTHKFLVDDAPGGANVKRRSLEMARTCGLASFNDYRQHFGLEPYEDFESLTGDKTKAKKLKDLYGDVDKLEWFVGIFAEGYGEHDMMGELMVTMVANDAFTQALTNPLLAKALYNAQTFSPEGFKIVEDTRRLSDVMARNTGLAPKEGDSFVLLMKNEAES